MCWVEWFDCLLCLVGVVVVGYFGVVFGVVVV